MEIGTDHGDQRNENNAISAPVQKEPPPRNGTGQKVAVPPRIDR